MKYVLIGIASLSLAVPALAESHAPAETMEVSGDAASGETLFGRQCIACHVVANDDGDVLAGRNARTGPNLYGVAMRQPGAVEGFRYGDAIVALGEAGQLWSEENFVGYVQNPTGWLRETLDDKSARGKMAFKVRSETDASDIYAYLVSIGPEIDMDAVGGAASEGAPSN